MTRLKRKILTTLLLIADGFFLSFATTHDKFTDPQWAITGSWILFLVIPVILITLPFFEGGWDD